MTTIGSVAAGQTAVMAPSRRRFIVMTLLFVTVVINYLDRSNMSIAAPALAGEFHLDPVQLGLVFSAFGWTYTPFQLPGGWLVDRVHPRILYPATIMLWSLVTLTLGMATGLLSLIVLRMAVGLFEVPTFLINNRIATTWFGEKERATCIAVYTAAELVGLAFMTPLLFWLKVALGWPSVFFFTGALGLVWACIFFRSYRDPPEMPGINAAELKLIEDSGGIPDLSSRGVARRAAQGGSVWRDLKIVLDGGNYGASISAISFGAPSARSSEAGSRPTWSPTGISPSSRPASMCRCRSSRCSAACCSPAWSPMAWCGAATA